MAYTKRKDSSRAVLKKGELQRPNGTYSYSWYDCNHKRHYIYGKTLEELRCKEKEVAKKDIDGLRHSGRYMTLNDIYNIWKEVKRGLKLNTFENYKYTYETFVKDSLGRQKIVLIKKTDVRRFYNTMVDERGLSFAMLDNIQSVVHQLFDMAIDDGYISSNPADRVLKEIKKSHSCQTEERCVLTKAQQDLFLRFLRENPTYRHWYPVFSVMLGTGLRVGEISGLRWCDVDLEKGFISINHTLAYFCHRDEAYKKGCYFEVHSPKTKNSVRNIPMLDIVKESLKEQKSLMDESGAECKVIIDGYSDFIFLNKDGLPFQQGILNKALRRIIRDCNDAEFEKDPEPNVLLPHFSCHTLRHTFTTRAIEAGMNVKALQNFLGHKDIQTTLGRYAHQTDDLMFSSILSLEDMFAVPKI